MSVLKSFYTQEQAQAQVTYTSENEVDIRIEIDHGIRHFVQMLRRGESGTTALIGQT